MKKFLFLATVATSLFLSSCSEKELTKPAVTADANAKETQPGVAAAAVQTSPTPGNYKVD